LKPKVFVPRPLPAPALDLLAAQCDVHVHSVDAALKPAQLAVACRDVEGLLAVGVRVNDEVLNPATRLRVVANCGVGYDNFDVAACTRRKIVVTNTPGVLTDASANLAFALLLAVARRVVEADQFVRAGRWERWEFGTMWGRKFTTKPWGFTVSAPLARRWRGAGARCESFIIRAAGRRNRSSVSSRPAMLTRRHCSANLISSACTCRSHLQHIT
jgi:glyoxylate reductase